MAKINLTIEADSAEDLRKTLKRLTGDDGVERVSNPEHFETRVATVPASNDAGAAENAPDVQLNPEGTVSGLYDAPDTDSNGLPWDERIHASSKAVNKDGTWRRRKGVSDEEVALIEAELRDTPATKATVETVATAVTDPAPEASSAPTVESMPQPQAEQPAAAPFNFPTMMKALVEGTNSGKIDQGWLKGLQDELGLSNITQAASKPEMMAKIEEAFRAKGLV